MIRTGFLLVFMINTVLVNCQNSIIEFEGVIRFSHEVEALENSYDTSYDYDAIGVSSDFYYKEGNCKFELTDAYFASDIFISEKKMNYVAIANSDTILYSDATRTDIEVLDYQMESNVDTILGYSCDMIVIRLKPINAEGPISLRRYYFNRELAVDHQHFLGVKGNCYDLIYSNTKAVPLRIEFEWPQKLIRWEAEKIIRKRVKDREFDLEKRHLGLRVN